MKEILFRGKRRDNSEWVYGDFTRYSEAESIINVDLLENETYWVLTETVGQYTGFKDKNGNKIYEGDVVRWGDRISPVSIDEGMTLVWSNTYERLLLVHLKNITNKCQIIGNIHDNPELVGEDHE